MEINENYFKGNIQELTGELTTLQAQEKRMNAKYGIDTKSLFDGFEPGEMKAYGKYLTLKNKIDFVLGRLKAFKDMLKRFLAKKEDKDVQPPVDPKKAVKPDEGDSAADPKVDTAPSGNDVQKAGDDTLNFLDKNDFREFVLSFVAPKKGGLKKGDKISEEQLQHATVAYMIKNLYGDDALKSYMKGRGRIHKGTKDGVENATKRGLQALVKEGVLTEKDAKRLNGMTFKAAQLDDNRRKLGGHRGEDSATKGVIRAINEAFKSLLAVKGGLKVRPRPL